MSPNPSSPRASTATWFYRQLLRLYPVAFRRRYEEEMILVFVGEWQRASDAGVVAQCRCGLHLMWDLIRTAPREWAARIPRIAVLALAAAGLSARYIAVGPMPLLLKVLGCACLTTAFAVAAVAVAGRTRVAQLKLAVLGLPIGLALALFLGLNPKPIPPPESPLVAVADPALTGSAIYKRMRAVYADARTYVDQGEEQSVISGFLGFVQTKSFSTAFVRDGGFSFEFRDQYIRLDTRKEYVIWKDGATVNSWWTLMPRVRMEKDLAHALAAAAGVSGSTSLQIPGLLHPEISTWLQAGRRPSVVLLGAQRVAGHETFRLRIDTPSTPAVTMWIDARSFLIHRISSSTSLPVGRRADQTIVYRPQLDVPVSPSALTFQPGSMSARWWMWRMLVGGEIYAILLTSAATSLLQLVNTIHRRLLRKRGKRKESWLAPITRRTFAGNIAILTVSTGMWLGGMDVYGVLRNLLLAGFMLQGGLMLHVIHRRSRGHARFAAAH